MVFYMLTHILYFFDFFLFHFEGILTFDLCSPEYLEGSYLWPPWNPLSASWGFLKFKSCFSGVLWYTELEFDGELGSDGAMLVLFLLVFFLSLPFATWLSLFLAGVAVSDCVFSVLLGDPFSLYTLVCKYFCENCSLVFVFGYVAMWPWSNLCAGSNWKTPVPGCS